MKKDSKVLIRFILLMALAMAAGGIMGYASASHQQTVSGMLTVMMDMLITAAPAGIAVSGLLTVLSFTDYGKGKTLTEKALAGGEESDYDAAEKQLEKSLEKGNYSLILSYTALGMLVSGFAGKYTATDMPMVLVALAVFFMLMLVNTFIQSALVKQVKRLNPEKQGNALDPKFHQDWLDSCDEAQRALIGKAAYAAYRATQKAILATMLVAMAVSFEYPLGPLPVVLLGAIWLVQTAAYMKTSHSEDFK